MRRSEMVCARCIKVTDGFCHLGQLPVPLNTTATEAWARGFALNPNTHWCAQGEWREWSDRHKEWIKLFWGEWETDANGETVA